MQDNHSKSLRDFFHTNWQWTLCVQGSSGNIVYQHNDRLQMEGSSIIKVKIADFFMQMLIQDNIAPTAVLPIKKSHMSRGSGILNWAGLKTVSIKDVIEYTFIYSDCVATNMMLDYIGKVTGFNKLLQQENPDTKTKLLLYPIDFKDTETDRFYTPVCTVNTFDTSTWLKNLEFTVKKTPYVSTLASLPTIGMTWFRPELSTQPAFEHFRIKSGSMVDMGSTGDTILNLIGGFSLNDQVYYFSFLSRGPLRGRSFAIQPEECIAFVSTFLYQKLLFAIGKNPVAATKGHA